ncbi:pyridoxal phosphate-dependent transferase [Entophlyctis helioformis]|nr:pyridoxal phosphate-dependent transferase [Entophlyctis helioformis]
MMRYLDNPYNAATNPSGIINLGTAENQLMHPELLPKLAADSFVTPDMASYGAAHGSPRLRTLIADLLNRHLHPVVPIGADHVFCQAGCGASVSNVTQALTNPGDGVLVPSPYYGGFDYDLAMYAQAKIVPVPTTAESGFIVSVADLQTAYDLAVAQHQPIKMLLLTSPQNPVGNIIPRSHMMSLLAWAASHHLHVLVDEIYALSVFDPAAPFESVLSFPDLPDPANTHVVWGISKDFALNGLRLGTVITRHPALQQALTSLSVFTNISSLTDKLVSSLLADTRWVDGYIASNQQRLRDQYARTTALLAELGIPHTPSTATFFVWMDLTDRVTTADAESALWARLIERGVLVSPGAAFHHPQPGWFRLVFTVAWDTLVEGLHRAFDTRP